MRKTDHETMTNKENHDSEALKKAIKDSKKDVSDKGKPAKETNKK